MTDLATLTDVEDRIGRNLTVDEQRIATRLLADASAAVRLYTGQQFTLDLDDQDPPEPIPDVVKLKVRNGKVRLPQRPVVEISTVTYTAADLTETTLTYTYNGIQTLNVIPSAIYALDDWYPCATIDVVTVTYTHGYPAGELPAALVGLVVQIVGRAMGSELIDSGLTAENIAGYGYTKGSAAAAGGFGLLPAEKAALDMFRRVGGYVQVGP